MRSVPDRRYYRGRGSRSTEIRRRPVLDQFTAMLRRGSSPAPESLFEKALTHAIVLAGKSRASSTRQREEWTWRIVERALAEVGLRAVLPMTDEMVSALYGILMDRGYALGTINGVRSLIAKMHRWAGFENPCAHELPLSTYRGISRDLRDDPVRRMAAVTPAEVVEMAALALTGDHRLRGLQECAILLFVFAAALRRSEAVALDLCDVRFRADGAEVIVWRSKTRQTRSRTVWVARTGSKSCPVAALERWITAAGIRRGPIFRRIDKGGSVQPRRAGGCVIAKVVKKHAAALGLDPTVFAGHSLRAGVITGMIHARVPLAESMAHAGHEDVDTHLIYFRPRDGSTTNLTRAVGL